MNNLLELGLTDLREVFAALFQLLEGFDDGLGHAPMRLLGAADDRELFARGQAFVAVLIVEAEADEGGGFLAFDLAVGLTGFLLTP